MQKQSETPLKSTPAKTKTAGFGLDVAFVVIALTIGSLAFYFLAYDLDLLKNIYESAEVQTPSIAHLDNANRIVKRKPAHLPAWYPASDKERLNTKDQVFTDFNSSARLAFDDNTVVELDQNTLIVVERDETKTSLNLIHGDVVARTSPGNTTFELKAGNTRTVISREKSEIRLTRKKTGQVSVAVTSGKAQIISADKSLNLEKSQQTEVSQDGKVGAAQDIPVILELPEHLTRLFFTGSSTVINFRWKVSQNVSKRLEIAFDAEFSNILLTKDIKDASTSQIEIPGINEGTYYWRIITTRPEDPTSQTSQISATSRFDLFQERPPTIIWPPEGYTIGLVATEGKANPSLAFDWQAQYPKEHYKLQIATDSGFKSVLSTFDTKSPPFVEPSLLTPKKVKAGTFFWRVGFLLNNVMVWSHPASFKILLPPEQTPPPSAQPKELTPTPTEDAIKEPSPAESSITPPPANEEPKKEAPPVLPPPKLKKQYRLVPKSQGAHKPLNKSKNQKIFLYLMPFLEHLDKLFEDHAYGENPPASVSVINWDPIPSATGYHVVVSTNEDFSKPLVDRAVQDPFFEFSPPGPGLFYLKVATINEKGVEGPFSSASSIIMPMTNSDLGTPTKAQKFETQDSTFAVTFSFKKATNASSYLIEIAEDSDFKVAIHSLSTSATQASLKLPSGKQYFWRVKPQLANVSEDSSSAPQSFMISLMKQTPPPPPPPKIAPQLLEPTSKAVITARRSSGAQISFSWASRMSGMSGMSGASEASRLEMAQYEFQLAYKGSFNELLVKKLTAQTSFKATLEPGDYHWRVRAFDQKQKAGPWAKPHSFSVKLKIPASKPSAKQKTKPPQPKPSLTKTKAKTIHQPVAHYGLFEAAFAPSIFRYNFSGTAPNSKLSGTLLSSGFLHARYWLTDSSNLTAFFAKKSMTMEDPNETDQEGLSYAPQHFWIALKRLFFESDTPGLLEMSAHIGYLNKKLVRFSRTSGQKTSLSQYSVHGILYGLSDTTALSEKSQVSLDADAVYSPASWSPKIRTVNQLFLHIRIEHQLEWYHLLGSLGSYIDCEEYRIVDGKEHGVIIAWYISPYLGVGFLF